MLNKAVYSTESSETGMKIHFCHSRESIISYTLVREGNGSKSKFLLSCWTVSIINSIQKQHDLFLIFIIH